MLDGADFAGFRFRIRIAEEAIRREANAVAHAPAENVADRNAPRLAENIQTREFQRGMNLSAIVVERCGGIGDEKSHLLQPRRIVADKIGLHRAKRRFGGFAAAAHFAKADESVVGFNFDDGSNEASPVHAVGMTQWSFQRNGDGCRADVGDFHNVYRRNNISEPFEAVAAVI